MNHLFDQAYDQENYLEFLDDKFNFSKDLTETIFDAKNVEQFKRLGFITTADDKKLPVFEIYIKPERTKLARNRVQLRNMVAKEIDTEDGALAVYVDEENRQWRFSFIAVEYKLMDGSVTKVQTASKRFTYMLGENTQTRTAKDRFKAVDKSANLAKLTEAFSVENLNKEFYDKLLQWYENAKTEVNFPNDEKTEDDESHRATSIIRLLTRLLFVWFIKEKDMVSKNLFDEEKLKKMIDWNEPNSFYKAILQNLFFATLSVEIDSKTNEREFRTSKNFNGVNKDYGDQYLYRYDVLVKDKEKWQQSFRQTPFLNGGLFENLDRKLHEHKKDSHGNFLLDKDGNKIINIKDKKLIDEWDKSIRQEKRMIRMDGFSDRPDNKLKFANDLFFSENTSESGLIDILRQYQFTVEESTPLDIEVALDPELLGKVFENLLATYNPETGAQARKATGSFYTPREIVSYMVDESLKQYFKIRNLSDASINALFIEDENLPDKTQIKKIIIAIDSLKILDPAVGSGAYPMGVLQRLIFILNKIDPENTHFKQQKLDKAEKMDEASKNASIKAIEQVFSKENQHNAYSKKLMLIENAIYGVDIQPIAIQICKLRFFISLAIEQTRDDTKKNYGITPLPNLETKFIVANTLLPLGEMSTQSDIVSKKSNIDNLRQELERIRHKHFNAKTLKTKRDLRQKDEKIRETMEAELTKDLADESLRENAHKIATWDLYNQDSVSDWFDAKWMFGIENGFDIVIGNPPYKTVGLDSKYRKKSQAIKYKFNNIHTNSANLFSYFIERGILLLSKHGTITFIVPHSVSRVDGYKYIRKYINDNSILWQIVDEYNQFENVTLEMVTLFCSKNIKKPKHIKSLSKRENKTYQMPNDIYDISGYYPMYYDGIYRKMNENETEKIGGFRGFNVAEKKNGDVLCIGGKNVKSYNIKIGYKEYYVSKQELNLKKEEIVITQFGASPRGTIIETSKIIPSDGCVVIRHADELLPKFTLALINSLAIKYFFDRYIVNNAGLTVHLDGHYLKKLPIPKISNPQQQPFIKLVDKILIAKKQSKDKDTSELEAEIDQLVYKLYNLTEAEIALIKGTPCDNKKKPTKTKP